MKSEQLAWLIRRHGVEMTHLSRGSHIGAIFSAADIMSVLFSDVLKYKADEPDWEGRDRFILSKGHAGAAMYAALAECGFFPVEELKTQDPLSKRQPPFGACVAFCAGDRFFHGLARSRAERCRRQGFGG